MCSRSHEASIEGLQPLRQGEILSEVVLISLALESVGTAELAVDRINHPFAVILTQDCDLEQDFLARMKLREKGQREDRRSQKLIPGVLLCEVMKASDFQEPPSSERWERIRKNDDGRFQFLQSCGPDDDLANEGIPELLIDFKRYFTIPTDVVYRSVELRLTRRRSVLASPYLEHLSSRFANYISRVALPKQHQSEPD